MLFLVDGEHSLDRAQDVLWSPQGLGLDHRPDLLALHRQPLHELPERINLQEISVSH